MKQIYLFALIGLLPLSAQAGEWEFDISGRGKGLYGYSDVAHRFEYKDKDHHGAGDGEVDTSAVYTFDNDDYSMGLYADFYIGVDRELQSYNQGRWGEEVYTIADSPYGRLMLGQTLNVGAQFYEGAPTVGALKNNNDVVDFIANPNWKRNSKQAKFSTLNTTYINTDGVAPKVSYLTPELYGTSLGFSYIPDAYNRRGLINKHASYARKDGYIGALSTEQELSALNIKSSAAVAKFHNNDTEYSISMLLEYGNWSLGGGWRKTYIDGNDKQKSTDIRLPELFDGYREGQAWEAGIGYRFGPVKSALSYFESKAESGSCRDKVWMLSNQYQINKYADIYLAAAHVDFAGSSPNLADNNQGWALVTGIGLSF